MNTMLDSQVLQRYIQDTMPEGTKTHTIRATEGALINFFKDIPVDAGDNITREMILDGYSHFEIGTIRTFYTNKSRVCDFFRWGYENGLYDLKTVKLVESIESIDIPKANLSKYYFRDYNDFYSFLRIVFEDREEFDTFQSAALLVWHGIWITDLVDILKTDLYEDEKYIINPKTKKSLYLPDPTIKILKRYKNADGFETNKLGGVVLSYVPSDYLFRSYKLGHYEWKVLSNTSNPANKLAKEYGKVFQWKRIYLSGIYYRIWLYEQEHGKINRNDFETNKILFCKSDLKNTPSNRTNLRFEYDNYQEFLQEFYS